jgi:WD40 repeat protein
LLQAAVGTAAKAAAKTPTAIPLAAFTNTPPATLPPGQRGRGAGVAVSPPGYKIVAELGRGGMGVVYKARQINLNRVVALKMILAGSHASAADLARFKTEAEAIARLQHPNIVQIHEVGEHQGLPFFSLDFCDGGSLDKKLNGTPLPPRQAAILVEKLARAMQAAHAQGIIHRDLKPANVLLAGVRDRATGGSPDTPSMTPAPIRLIPKISDFGLAKKLDEAGKTQTGAILGTPSYMAPEQAGGKSKELGPACDIYALGAILYECLTGRPPFRAAEPLDTVYQVLNAEPVAPSSLQAKTPLDLETICLKCLRKEPTQRYASAAALADDLRRWQAGEPIAARPVSQLERGWRWCRRHPATATAASAVAALLFTAAVALIAFTVREVQAASNLKAEKDETERIAADLKVKKAEADRVSGELRVKIAEVERVSGELRVEKNRTQDALNESRLMSARFALEKGQQLAEHGSDGVPDVEAGMLWMARALELAPDGAEDLKQAARLNLALWARELFLPRGELPLRCTLVAAPAKGKRFVTAAGQIGQIWDLDTAQPVARRLVHDSDIQALACSADGTRVLTGTADGKARLWNLATGEPVGKALEHPAAVVAAALSPDGAAAVVLCKDGTVQFWDLAKAQMRGKPVKHNPPMEQVIWSRDGRFVLTHSGDAGRRIQLWDGTTGAALGEPRVQGDRVFGIGLHPDGQSYLVAHHFTFHLAETKSGGLLKVIGQDVDYTGAIDFTPDGRKALVACGYKNLRLLDLTTGQLVGNPIRLANWWGNAAYCLDDRHVLTKSVDRASLWQKPLFQTAQRFPRPDPNEPLKGGSEDMSLSVSADGSVFVAAGKTRKVRLQSARDGKAFGPWFAHDGVILAVCLSRDGRFLLTGGTDKVARLWNVETGEQVGPPLVHADGVGLVAISPDGKTLLTSGGETGCWEASTGKRLRDPLPMGVRCLAISGDGKQFAGGRFNESFVWDTASGKVLANSLPHARWARGLVFSSDGDSLFGACEDRLAYQWSVPRAAPVGDAMAHPGWVTAIALSPNGRVLATGCSDGTRLWDAASHKRLGPILRLPDSILSQAEPWRSNDLALQFADGGRALLVCASNQEVARWDLPEPLTGSSQQLTCWTELITSTAMDKDGGIHRLDWADRVRARQRFRQLGGLRALEPPEELWQPLESLAEAHAHRGEWAQAAACCDQLLGLQPEDAFQWYRAAIVHTQLANKKEYRRLCQEMLQRFGSTLDPTIAERTVKACSLMPGLLDDLGPVTRLADLAVSKDPNHPSMASLQFAKGLAEYRAGHHADAARWLEKSLAKAQAYLPATAAFALAMAQQQQSQTAQAKATLARAQETLSQLPSLERSGGSWLECVYTDQMRREAEALIGGKQL